MLGLISSSKAGAVGEPGFTRVYLLTAAAHPKLRSPGCSSGSHPGQEMHDGVQEARIWPGAAFARQLSVGSLPGEADGVWFFAPVPGSRCELN